MGPEIGSSKAEVRNGDFWLTLDMPKNRLTAQMVSRYGEEKAREVMFGAEARNRGLGNRASKTTTHKDRNVSDDYAQPDTPSHRKDKAPAHKHNPNDARTSPRFHAKATPRPRVVVLDDSDEEEAEANTHGHNDDANHVHQQQTVQRSRMRKPSTSPPRWFPAAYRSRFKYAPAWYREVAFARQQDLQSGAFHRPHSVQYHRLSNYPTVCTAAPVPATLSRFESLPGEIRNRIYCLVFGHPRVLVMMNKPMQEVAQKMKLWQYQDQYVQPPKARLYCVLDRDQIERGESMDISILLLNHQIKAEAQYFLYSTTQFCFSGLKVLEKFGQETLRSNVRSIKNLEIAEDCYGLPRNSRDHNYHQRHEQKWQSVCARIGADFTDLETFVLHSRLRKWPLAEIKTTSWYRSLMLIVRDRKLQDVTIHLNHPNCDPTLMNEMVQALEEEMMEPAAWEERQRQLNLALMRRIEAAVAAEQERLRKLPLQTNKTLRIVITSPVAAPNGPSGTSVDADVAAALAPYIASIDVLPPPLPTQPVQNQVTQAGSTNAHDHQHQHHHEDPDTARAHGFGVGHLLSALRRRG